MSAKSGWSCQLLRQNRIDSNSWSELHLKNYKQPLFEVGGSKILHTTYNQEKPIENLTNARDFT